MSFIEQSVRITVVVAGNKNTFWQKKLILINFVQAKMHIREDIQAFQHTNKIGNITYEKWTSLPFHQLLLVPLVVAE